MATVADVARKAGVSPGIVSRLLNEDPTLRVREATRVRVVAAARALDYTPNAAARALRKASAGMIGLAVHDTTNPIFGEIIAGAQSAATAAGFALMLADVHPLASDEQSFRRLLSSGAVDGLLLQRAGTEDDALIARIAQGRVPTVLLNDSETGPLSSVWVDDELAARMSTEHLLALGHRNIALLQLQVTADRAERRRRGWEAALHAAGLPAPDELVVAGGHAPETGYVGMQRLIAIDPKPTAVFAANVMAAVGAVRAAADAGLRVPEDISIAALHDLSFGDYTTPRLTIARLPLFEMGERAIGILLEQRHDGMPRHELVSQPAVRMVVRESTAPPSQRSLGL